MNAEEYSERVGKFLSEKNFDGAIADFTEAIKLEPDNPFAYYKRGMAYVNKNEFDLAIKDFTEAIRIEPDKFGDFYLDRGGAYLFKGDKAMAISDVEMALKIDPQSESYQQALEDIKNSKTPPAAKASKPRTGVSAFIIIMIIFGVIGAILGIAVGGGIIGALIGLLYGIGIASFWEDFAEEVSIHFGATFDTIKETLSDDIAEQGFFIGGLKGIFIYTPFRFLLCLVIFIFWPGLKLLFKFIISPFVTIYRLIVRDF
jgi:tetratricopeptide (TPR) repeat protein